MRSSCLSRNSLSPRKLRDPDSRGGGGGGSPRLRPRRANSSPSSSRFFLRRSSRASPPPRRRRASSSAVGLLESSSSSKNRLNGNGSSGVGPPTPPPRVSELHSLDVDHPPPKSPPLGSSSVSSREFSISSGALRRDAGGMEASGRVGNEARVRVSDRNDDETNASRSIDERKSDEGIWRGLRPDAPSRAHPELLHDALALASHDAVVVRRGSARVLRSRDEGATGNERGRSRVERTTEGASGGNRRGRDPARGSISPRAAHRLRAADGTRVAAAVAALRVRVLPLPPRRRVRGRHRAFASTAARATSNEIRGLH